MAFDENVNSDEQRPRQQTFIGSLRRDTHWKCLVLTLLMFACFCSVTWCCFGRRPPADTRDTLYHPARTRTDRPQVNACAHHYIYIPVSLSIVVYLFYLVECWHSHTRLQLQCKVDARVVYERMRAMREAAPNVWWRSICYHYIRRTRHVTRYRNGDAFTTTRVHYERVNSHNARVAFDYTPCGARDLSKPVAGLELFPATKIRLSKGFSFACARAANEYELQRTAFFRSCARNDDYMEASEGMDLSEAGFKPAHVIAFADANHLPWYVSQASFWICSVFLMSWPLRVLIEYRTARLHYHVHKLFGINYLLLDAGGSHSTMSRAVTVGSDIERCILDNNYAIAPSYSDAILMDSAAGLMTDTPRDRHGNITSSVSFPHRLGLLSSHSGNPRRVHSHGYVSTSSSALLTSDSARCSSQSTQPCTVNDPSTNRYRWTDTVSGESHSRRGIISYVSSALFQSSNDNNGIALLKHKRKRRCRRPSFTDRSDLVMHGNAVVNEHESSPMAASESTRLVQPDFSQPSTSGCNDDDSPPSYEAALSMRFLRSFRTTDEHERMERQARDESHANVKETYL